MLGSGGMGTLEGHVHDPCGNPVEDMKMTCKPFHFTPKNMVYARVRVHNQDCADLQGATVTGTWLIVPPGTQNMGNTNEPEDNHVFPWVGRWCP